jgi:hypothetical protein
MNDAALVDDDHRIRNGVKDRLEVSLSSQNISSTCGGLDAASLQLRAAPRNSDADQREHDGDEDFGR